jgi:predicted phage terminase large subunit-like protein
MPGSSHDSQSPASQSNLVDWASLVLEPNGQSPALHQRFLLKQLEAVGRGEIDRLMVLMPPGSAKSTYTSILYPAWWFTQHPNSSVIAASHTKSLAEHFGRQARELVRENTSHFGYTLHGNKQAAGHWQTSSRGEYFAAGVRGPLTGHRADLVIIDDPIRSHAEADSPLLRERIWNWYRSDVITRLKPKGRIILVMTRWHEDDLAGRLLALNAAEWQVIRLPAVAENHDVLGRAPGAALWPEWEDETALARKRDTVGERTWSTLFQQSPRPIQGSLFRTGCIDILDMPPTLSASQVVRAWDLAATVATGGNDADWTVGVKLGCDDNGRYVVLDVVRLRGSPHEVEDAIAEAARVDGTSIAIGLPEDPGQAGKSQVTYLTGRLAGHRIASSRETGAKVTRAGPVASQVEGRNVAMVRANWNHAFIEELRDFPFGRKDDQVDALSHAFRMLTAGGAAGAQAVRVVPGAVTTQPDVVTICLRPSAT